MEVAGAGAFVHSSAFIFDSNRWGHVQNLDGRFEGGSHIFSGIIGLLQSVQRCEYWGAIIALQAYSGTRIGIDNLSVLGVVAKMILPLVQKWPPFSRHSMSRLWGNETVKVIKGKGHATQAMVDNGDAPHEDLIGNDGADTAADLGRLRQRDGAITARRALIRVRRHWYPIMLELHKFMVAISRIEVNHDGHGGTARDAMMWDKGSVLKPRTSSLRVIVDHASLPGPLDFWTTLGVAFSFSPSLRRMCLFGPTVSASSWSFLPFWPRCIGLRMLLTWENSVFLSLSCFLCLNSTQVTG